MIGQFGKVWPSISVDRDRCSGLTRTTGYGLPEWAVTICPLGLAGTASVRFDRASAAIGNMLAGDLQEKQAAQHSHRRRHPHAETRHGRIAPLLRSVSHEGITDPSVL